MLEQFFKTIKGDLGKKILGASNMDSGSINNITDVVTDTFKDGIIERFNNGQISDIVGLLGKGGSKSPFAGGLVSNVVKNLISKLGLSPDLSNTIASVAIPFIIDKFSGFAAEKGKDNEDGINDLMADLISGSIKDKFLGGLGKKFGF